MKFRSDMLTVGPYTKRHRIFNICHAFCRQRRRQNFLCWPQTWRTAWCVQGTQQTFYLKTNTQTIFLANQSLILLVADGPGYMYAAEYWCTLRCKSKWSPTLCAYKDFVWLNLAIYEFFDIKASLVQQCCQPFHAAVLPTVPCITAANHSLQHIPADATSLMDNCALGAHRFVVEKVFSMTCDPAP